jgi:putative DNA primase/helicase
MYFDNIPEELKKINRWVCWKLVERDGRPTKIPINPFTGGQAMSNNPDTWSDYWTAHDKMVSEGYSGIGFMFNSDGIVGVDIDHCRDTETGELTELARDIIATLDSYTELSQSGTGIHIICRGKLPEGRRKKEPVEMYENVRYFCMTGAVLDDAHMDIEERTAELAAVHSKYVNVQKKRKNDAKSSKKVADPPVFVDDDKIIEIAMNAANGDLFTDLMNGNWKGRYTSQSEADIALCNLLAFYCQRDAAQMQRLFRRSGLYREKWDLRRGEKGTYGEITIAKAIEDCGETYTPRASKGSGEHHEEPPEINLGLDHIGEPPPEELPDWILGPYNDTWNAERLVEKFGENIRYNPSRGWYIWNGKLWEFDELNKVRTMANDAIESLYRYEPAMKSKFVDNKKLYDSFVAWLAKARNTSRKDNMIREAESWQNIRTLPKHFDTGKCLVNLQNGTMDMSTMTFYSHRKDDLITKIMPVDYDPKARTRLWDEFLDKIFQGNQNIINFLQRAVGYSFSALTNEQCIFILYGTGKNGKSTFLDTIKRLMADYTRNAPVATFMRKDWGSSSDYELARLFGARLVTTGEPDKGDRFAESLIKQITGGESINASHKYKDPFEYYPEFKLWIGTNYKPEIVGTDLGIWRRIMLVPFDVVIPPEERDVNFGEKLLAELPGIFNWVMEGFTQWQRRGLDPPSEVLAATEDYREEMDIFQNFLNDCTIVKPGAVIKFKDLYKVYQEWARENGIKNPMNSNTIGRRLKEKGIREYNTKFAKGREGIELSDEGKRLWRKGIENLGNDEPQYFYQESFYDDDELPDFSK